MMDLDEGEQLALINSLILDCHVLIERTRTSNGVMAVQRNPKAAERVRALGEFVRGLSQAVTLLRQEGLHPDSQGRML